MGARTAWLIDPYLDAGRGMPLMDMGDLAQRSTKAEAAGLAVMVHAVGDRANRELIDLFAALADAAHPIRPAGPAHCPPHRTCPDDPARRCRPPAQPGRGPLRHAAQHDPGHQPDRRRRGCAGRHTYAFRRLLDTGVPVMFSSDCPVCDPDPLVGMHAAVTRQRADGTPAGGWYPQQRVSVAEAVAAYTATPAAVHRAFDLGASRPGNGPTWWCWSGTSGACPRRACPRSGST